MRSAVGTAMDRRPRRTAFKGTFQMYSGVGSERINSGCVPESCWVGAAHPADGNTRRQKIVRAILTVNDQNVMVFHIFEGNKNVPFSLPHVEHVWPGSRHIFAIYRECPGPGCRVAYCKIDPPI